MKSGSQVKDQMIWKKGGGRPCIILERRIGAVYLHFWSPKLFFICIQNWFEWIILCHSGDLPNLQTISEEENKNKPNLASTKLFLCSEFPIFIIRWNANNWVIRSWISQIFSFLWCITNWFCPRTNIHQLLTLIMY